MRFGELAYLPRLVRGHEQTRREFAEEAVIARLAVGREPIEGIGVGLSERVVEIPWVLRRLAAGGGERVLDIGTAFSPMVYKWLLVRQPHTVEVADLAEVDILGLRGHVADVRSLPFADASFDQAICLSTLEHIGMDNTQYGIESGGGGDVDALRELGRVARTVLVTVPAGRDENMGWQRQYTPRTFRRVVEEAGLAIERLDVFAHDPRSGWAPADDDSVASRTYGEGAVAAAASICAALTRR
jgi:Methyltransferase domain